MSKSWLGIVPETPTGGREFVIDSTAPSVAISNPAQAYMKAVTLLEGAVSDLTPGALNNTYFRVKRQAAAEYWNWQASTFTALSGAYTDLTAGVAAGLATYTTDYFANGRAWEPNKTYVVQLFSTDKAGNLGTASEQTFTLDVSSPSSRLLVPLIAAKNGIKTMSYISGTAYDAWRSTAVEVAIRRLSGTPRWYNGAGFNEAVGPVWLDVNNTVGYLSSDATSWMYAPAGLDGSLDSGGLYWILCRARDVATNVQDLFTADISSMVVKVDKTAPSSLIVYPADDSNGVSGRYKPGVVGQDDIRGTADDNPGANNSGVADVKVRLSYLQTGVTYYWTGAAFVNVSSETAWLSTALDGTGAPPWIWEYTGVVGWPAGDREYTLETKSMDLARDANDGVGGSGNTEVWPYPFRRFIVDATPPSVVITTPTVLALKAFTRGDGNVDALLAGHKWTDVRISTTGGDGTRYWDDDTSSWLPSVEWNQSVTLGPTSWYYTVPPAMLRDDVVYTMSARALDYANNYSAVYSTSVFTYDITPPVVSVGFPLHDTAYSQIKISTPLAGTSSQPGQNSAYTGVSTVAVQVTDLDGGPSCWTGSAWAGCPQWLKTEGDPATWGYDRNFSFINDHRYQIEARATDFAGNDSAVSNRFFRYDVEKPTSAVTYPLTGLTTGFAYIAGTAMDERYAARQWEAKLSSYTVKVAVKSLTTDVGWWDGSAFAAGNPVWYEANNSTTVTPNQFRYNLPGAMITKLTEAASQDPARSYRIVTWSYDLALNPEYGPQASEPLEADIPAGTGRVVTFDSERPVTAITMPNAANHNTLINITGTADDNVAIDSVRFTVFLPAQGRYYDPAFTPSPWSDPGKTEDQAPWLPAQATMYVTSAAWTYTIQDSTWTSAFTYRVRARSLDVSGNYDNVYSTATFLFDNEAPISTVAVPGSWQHLNTLPIALAGTSYDPGASGVSQVRVYLSRATDGWYWNGGSWNATPTVFLADPPLANWTMAISNNMFGGTDSQIYRVETNAFDAATNQEGYAIKTSFIYDVTRPTAAISYPYNNGYISAAGKITGGSYDMPNGVVQDVNVRIKKLTGVSDAGKYWSVAGSSWSVAAVSNSVLSYGTLSPSATWWQLNTAPWATNETYEMSAWAFDRAGNYQLVYATATNVKADFTNPISTITSPSHGTIIQAELNTVSGNAEDYAPGVLDRVLLSYFKMDTARYWNFSTHAWDSVDELFYDANIVGNNWTATGVSTPTWIAPLSGISYKVFAKAVDQAGNEVPKPGLTGPLSPYIEFTLKPPPPVSSITTPDPSVPHYKPAPAPTVIGTAVYATTVAVRVVDYGPDLSEGTGNDDLAWNGVAWLSTTAFTGFAGVDNYVNPNWQWTIPTEKWNVNRRYRVISRARHEVNGTIESPGVGVEFIVDSTAPSAGVTMPDKSYMYSLTSLAGTLSDVAPGDVVSAYFRVKRQEASQYWNWQASTFTAAGAYTNLDGTIAWNDILKTGTVGYATSYFTAGLAFEQNRSYVVELYATDKAGNLGSATAFTFTIDVSSPVARVTAPYDANKKGVRLIDAVTGTAVDNFTNSDVYLAMQQQGSPPLWFNGTDFLEPGSDPVWISMKTNGTLSPSATSWAYAPAGLDLRFVAADNGMKYLLLTKALDVAGNLQDVLAVDVSSIVINIDKLPPSSAFTFPLDQQDGFSGRYKSANVGKAATSTRFYGTAADSAYSQNNAGVAVGRFRLSYLSGTTTFYWQPSAFTSAISSETAWQPVSVSYVGPNWSWVYLNDITWPAGEREYKAEIKTMDDSRLADDSGDGNWEDPQSRGVNVRYFTVDDTPPTVTITTPTTTAVRDLPGFGGNANADVAGLDRVEVMISTGTGGATRYWNGTGWQTTAWPAVNSTKLGPTSWYYTLSPAALKDDVVYTLIARAVDYAGNVSSIYSTYTVTYDMTGPLVTLSFPDNGSTYSQILLSTPMAGTAVNNQTAAYSGPSTVTVAVSDLVNGTCFDGTTFVGCAESVWLAAQGTVANWTFSDKDLYFISDHSYKYEARSADDAGNYSGIASVTTKFDLDIPTATVTSPMTEYVRTLPLILGTAQDERNGVRTYEAGLGTYTVKVAVRLVGGNWWNGADAFNSANPVWYETAVDTAAYGAGQPVVDWQYTVPGNIQGVMAGLSGSAPYLRSYLLVPWAYDLAQNREFGPGGSDPANTDVPLAVGRTIKFDNLAPVSVTTAPANVTYQSSVLSLYGVATDTGVVSGLQVLIKARGTFNAMLKYPPYANTVDDWTDSGDKYLYWSTATYANGRWSLTLPSLDPVNNNKISVWTRALDMAGNWEASPSQAQIDANLKADNSAAYYFTYDSLLPLTGVTAPDRYALSVATGLIAGTAFDAGTEPSGVNEVRLRIRRSGTVNNYWSFINNNWTTAAPTDTFGVSGTNNWTKNIDKASQEDGYEYYVYHYAKDNALNNNSGAYFSTFTFTVDLTTPTSKITFPANNSFIGSVPAIAGTADDSVENIHGWAYPQSYEAGISTDTGVDLAIQRLSDDKWWDGTGFGGASRSWHLTAFNGTSSGTWVYNLPGGAIADGTTYYAMTRVRDLVDNIQTVFTTNYFTGDTTPPDSRATGILPLPSGDPSLINAITGTAQDTLPGELKNMDMVKIALRKTTLPAACYNNAANTWDNCPLGAYPGDRLWFSTGTVNDPRGQPGNWTWDTSGITWANGSYYDIQALAIDKAGNFRCQATPATCPGANSPDMTFRFVSPAAAVFITIPADEMGNYRSSALGALQGNGTNLRPTNSVQVRVKRAFEPVQWWDETNKNWLAIDTFTYLNADGGLWSMGISGATAFTVDNSTYTFSVIGYNSANEASPAANRNVIVDNTTPVGTVLSPNRLYVNAMPTISGTASDPGRSALPPAYQEGMSRVLVMIKDNTLGTYWNGLTFDAFMSSSNMVAAGTLN
jgi:hypothetical protein